MIASGQQLRSNLAVFAPSSIRTRPVARPDETSIHRLPFRPAEIGRYAFQPGPVRSGNNANSRHADLPPICPLAQAEAT